MLNKNSTFGDLVDAGKMGMLPEFDQWEIDFIEKNFYLDKQICMRSLKHALERFNETAEHNKEENWIDY